MGIASTGTQFDGGCCVCCDPITEGERIIDDGQGGWAHRSCWLPEERA
jgi:hypothetical protein